MIVTDLLANVVVGVENNKRANRRVGHTMHAANVTELEGIPQPSRRVQDGIIDIISNCRRSKGSVVRLSVEIRVRSCLCHSSSEIQQSVVKVVDAEVVDYIAAQEVEIITGISDQMKLIVINTINDYGFSYIEEFNNPGKLIVSLV